MTCGEFRAQHEPEVKFADLGLVVRNQLFEHWTECEACRTFVDNLPMENRDNSFDGKELARADFIAISKGGLAK